MGFSIIRAHLSILFFLESSLASIVLSNAIVGCFKRCAEGNIAFPLAHDETTWPSNFLQLCDYGCRVKACQTGCGDIEGLVSTCNGRCQLEVGSDSCRQGCHAVEQIFVAQLQELMNRIQITVNPDISQMTLEVSIQPELIPVKLSFPEEMTSLVQEISNLEIQWYAQSRSMIGNPGWKWAPLPQKSFRNVSIPCIVGVPREASAKAILRSAIAWRGRVVVSPSTQWAVPIDKIIPKLELDNHLQLANDKYSVCWRTNRQEGKFRVKLWQSDEDSLIEEIESTFSCHLFKNLPRSNCCRVSISDITDDPEHPILELSLRIELAEVPDRRFSKPALLITNGTHIERIEDLTDYELKKKPIMVPFELDDEDRITAIAGISEESLVVGTEHGGIWIVASPIPPIDRKIGEEEGEDEKEDGKNGEKDSKEPLDQGSNRENGTETIGAPEIATTTSDDPPIPGALQLVARSVKLRDPDGSSITHIVHDPMQRMVYALLSKKGLLRCSLDPTPCTFLNTPSPMQYISVDSWNGFVYFISPEGNLVQAELFSFNATDSYSFERTRVFTDLSPAMAIEIDYREQQLVVILQNGSVFGRDMVSGNTSQIRDGSYPNVKKIHLLDGRIFWTKIKCGDSQLDDVCFYSEERGEEEGGVHFSRYLLTGELRDFTFTEAPFYPCCLPKASSIGLISNDREARVTWPSLPSMNYQAMGDGWRNVHYECRLEALDGTSSQTQHTNGNDLMFPVIPGLEYRASVRGCSLDICSPITNVTNKATIGLIGNPVYILEKTSAGTWQPMDLLGQNTTFDPALSNFQYESGIRVAIDNTTRTVYSNSKEDPATISKWSLDSMSLEEEKTPDRIPFLHYFSITHLSMLASRSLLVVASPYTVVLYRLTGTFELILHACSSLDVTVCAEVIAVAADEITGDIYFLTQLSNGTTQLHQADALTRVPQHLASATDFPAVSQLAIIRDKLLFLDRNGRIGVVDKTLEELNMNYVIDKAEYLLPIWPTNISNRFDFGGDIIMGDVVKNDLTWSSVSRRKDDGSVLYQLSLYKGDLESDDIYKSVSLRPLYSIPLSLLDRWDSAQKFGVNIQALNAWWSKNISKSDLIAPTKPPSQPLDTRIFTTLQKTVDGSRAIISFFWRPPDEWNGAPFRYNLSCSRADDGQERLITQDLAPTINYYSFPVKTGKVSCSVSASNGPNNPGDPSVPQIIDSLEQRPLVRVFGIDSTNDLISIPNITDENGPRMRREVFSREKREDKAPILHYQAMAYIENNLYAIGMESDTVHPTLIQLDTNNISNIQHKVSLTGEFAPILSMASDWIGFRLLLLTAKSLYQVTLDPFLTSTILTPKKLADFSLEMPDPKLLTVDPFTNMAFILTKNGSIFTYDFAKGVESNLAHRIVCLASETVTWMTTEFTWNRPASPKINVLTRNGLLEVDLDGTCTERKNIEWTKFGDTGLPAIQAFAIADRLFLFVSGEELLVYRPGTDQPQVIQLRNPPLRSILAASQSNQPYPDRKCFSLPPSTQISFSVANEGKTGAVVRIDRPPTAPTCSGISMPTTIYDIYFNRTDKARVKHIESYTDVYHIENGSLDKETDYEVRVSWHNRWSSDSTISEAKKFRTGFGYPSPPQNPMAISVTPDTILLLWRLPETLNSPADQIKYKISQQFNDFAPQPIAVQMAMPNGPNSYSSSTTDIVSCLESPCRVKISNLHQSSHYKFWVSAVHDSHLNAQFSQDAEALSIEAATTTKDLAGTLRPDNVTGDSILLRWNSLQPEHPPTLVSVQYKESGGSGGWQTPKNASFDPREISSSIGILISKLLAATSYDYRFVAVYKGVYEFVSSKYEYQEEFYQGIQQARTKAGTPTEPQSVRLYQSLPGGEWTVEWQPPVGDGGSIITNYAVEHRPNHTADWEIAVGALDGRVFQWHPTRTEWAPHWQFQVKAKNSVGFGPPKATPIRPEDLEEENPVSWLPILIIASTIWILIMVVAFFLIARRRQIRRRQKPRVDDKSITLDSLVQLDNQHLGKGGKELSSQIDHEIRNLIQIPRSKLEIGVSLGEGLFGKVRRGELQQGNQKIPVAIKMLREKPDDAIKAKFFKEAILMNNFDHPNIVKLLAVSYSHDSNFYYLILELMEGGNLLDFLRDCRPMDTNPPSCRVTIKELLSMMMDVGRGASYLEQVHHVHRDLAARNCLISTRLPHRIAKIGDFGLTKMVEGNDYYQMRGTDFLPFRWLAPEAATLGLFSSKSDVWSYGVLLWEAMTLGDIPHGGLSEETVHQRVKQGVMLPRPNYCPEPIYKLMEMCWAGEPKERPSFSTILCEIDDLRDMPEYQNDKEKYPNCLLEPINSKPSQKPSIQGSGHVNQAFESSFSNEKEPPVAYVPGTSRGLENAKIDKGSSTAALRRPGRPTVVRSLRAERAKSNSIPSEHDHEPSNPPALGRSIGAMNAEDYGFSGRYPAARPRQVHRQITVPMMGQQQEPTDSAFGTEESHLSQSWSGPHVGVTMGIHQPIPQQPSPSNTNNGGGFRERAAENPSNSRFPIPFTSGSRKAKLSQVSQV